MLPKAPRPVFSDSLDGGTPPQLHCCAEYVPMAQVSKLRSNLSDGPQAAGHSKVLNMTWHGMA